MCIAIIIKALNLTNREDLLDHLPYSLNNAKFFPPTPTPTPGAFSNKLFYSKLTNTWKSALGRIFWSPEDPSGMLLLSFLKHGLFQIFVLQTALLFYLLPLIQQYLTSKKYQCSKGRLWLYENHNYRSVTAFQGLCPLICVNDISLRPVLSSTCEQESGGSMT